VELVRDVGVGGGVGGGGRMRERLGGEGCGMRVG